MPTTSLTAIVSARGRRRRRLIDRRRGWGMWLKRRHGRGTDSMGEASDKCGVGHASLQMLQTPFLIAKVGDRLLVGELGEQREVGGGITKILANTSHERGEEEGVGDQEFQIAELVREGLEMQAIGLGEVILVEAKELLLEEGGALELVVDEEAGDLLSHVVHGITIADDDVKDVGGDGLEEPADDGGVDGAPVGVVGHGEKIDDAIDVVDEIVLTEKEPEVRLAGEEVGRGVGELHRHALEDRDITDDSDEGSGEGVGVPRS
jgi:hypothetical protein